MNILYIALKHINYFREIFKFRDFMNTLRNFAKFVFARIFAKFKYLEKNYINGISRSRALKSPNQNIFVKNFN